MTAPDYVIRKARLYDIPAVARLEEATSGTPWSAESLTNDITKNENAYMAVAALKGPEDEVPEIIGYADIWIIAGEAQLNNIAVDEKYRGMHIGEALLEHMIEVSRRAGCTVMTLEVREGNTAARPLYTKLGFKETAVRRGYYTDNNEDAILMDKNYDDLDVEYETK